jgi:hypothetical protein
MGLSATSAKAAGLMNEEGSNPLHGLLKNSPGEATKPT